MPAPVRRRSSQALTASPPVSSSPSRWVKRTKNGAVASRVEASISARRRGRLSGSSCAVKTKRPAHWSASRSARIEMTTARDSRRKFSTSAMRSMIGTAQTSPIASGETSWKPVLNRKRYSSSSRESVCVTSESTAS